MELRRYLQLFWRRWPVLLACVVVGAAIGWATAPSRNTYSSTAEIYVGAKSLAQNQNQLYAEPGLNQVVATYAAMIPSPSFAQLALAGTGIDRSPDQVASATQAAVVTNTTLIAVTVKDSNPVIAQRLTNALSSTFARQAGTGPSATDPLPGVVPGESAYVFQYAAMGQALPRHTTRFVTLGAIFGLIVGILVVLLVDYLDTTVRGTESIERRLGLPVLAVVPVRRGDGLRNRSGRASVAASGSEFV